MDTTTQEVILGLAFFGLIITVTIIIARYTYLIRKALAENGLEAPKTITKERVIHWGGILIGLGIGLMVSSIVTFFEINENTADLLTWGIIILSGGLGLIGAYVIEQKLGR